MPGGYIVFNEGLLKAASSIEEVLGVAAHELAHVKERHILRSLVQSIGLYIVVDLIIGDMSGILAVVTENSQFLLESGFSREQEIYADRIGFDLLVQAEINPSGLMTFFETLQDTQKTNQLIENIESKFSFLSTHPATEDRIRVIRSRLEQEQVPSRKIDFDYNEYLANLDLSK